MSTNERGIGRRQFLITSSAAIAAAATVGPRLIAQDLFAPPRKLAVGYAPLEDSTFVNSASGILTTDGRFISRGARVSLSGVGGGSTNPQDRRSVELIAQYSYFDGAERRLAPFVAWGMSRKTGAQGSPISFDVPVDDLQTISFLVRTERSVGAPGALVSRRRSVASAPAIEETADALPITLGLLSGQDVIKLARGYYIIVPLFDGDSEPLWSSYELHREHGRWAMRSSDGPAPFEHFVVRIDYASIKR